MTFKCPKCGGPYFGRDPRTDEVQCHSSTTGGGIYETPEQITERLKAGTPRPKLCGWRGTSEEAEKARTE